MLEHTEDVQFVTVFHEADLDTIHRYVHDHQPDLILLDIHLGDEDGLKLGEYLLNRLPYINLVFLTGNDYPEYRRLAAGIGAKGFFSKSMNPHKLVANLRKINEGKELAIDHSPTRKILNDAELETLQLICTGATNSSIAEKLGVTERTIDYRIQKIKQKLDVSTMPEAVIKGVKLGLVRMHS